MRTCSSRTMLTIFISPEVGDETQQYLPFHRARITAIQVAVLTGQATADDSFNPCRHLPMAHQSRSQPGNSDL